MTLDTLKEKAAPTHWYYNTIKETGPFEIDWTKKEIRVLVADN